VATSGGGGQAIKAGRAGVGGSCAQGVAVGACREGGQRTSGASSMCESQCMCESRQHSGDEQLNRCWKVVVELLQDC
jgi:hypothetical protein